MKPVKRWSNIDRRMIGTMGEEAAVAYLKSIGIVIECRNFRTRYGELDIVGWDNTTLVFYEVKTVSSHKSWLSPVEAILPNQCRRIVKTAQQFMYLQHLLECECRFDAISVYLRDNEPCHVSVISPAFTL